MVCNDCYALRVTPEGSIGEIKRFYFIWAVLHFDTRVSNLAIIIYLRTAELKLIKESQANK